MNVKSFSLAVEKYEKTYKEYLQYATDSIFQKTNENLSLLYDFFDENDIQCCLIPDEQGGFKGYIISFDKKMEIIEDDYDKEEEIESEIYILDQQKEVDFYCQNRKEVEFKMFIDAFEILEKQILE